MKNCTASKAVRGTLLAVAALLAAGTTQAQAAAPPDLRAGNWLFLTVTKGDARSSDTRGTLLLCDPPQGHHRAAQACAELAGVNGDITALPMRAAYCPMIYAPVTAQARGQWNGRPVDYTQTFSNGCAMAGRTGSLFALDS
ncbi:MULTISPECIES: SSI family serine proteinase inhibitor [unclassified Streptomyces]|uniref:SSI family serine proteinase inhibitor n=1 Tax=unclassified Streptomyces TaxID=2593676 RepID=UPI0036E8F9D2